MKLTRTRQVIFLLVISFLISTVQFYFDYNQYSKLKQLGIITDTKVRFQKKFGSWMYMLEFKSKENVKIYEEGKCGKYEECKDYYEDLEVIYLPGDPTNFMELPDYKNYSVGYKIFFYFVLYGIGGAFILNGVVQVFKFIKENA